MVLANTRIGEPPSPKKSASRASLSIFHKRFRWIMTIKKGVLVVEDDTPRATMMALWLSRAGCEVQVAHDGDKGMELATETRFDLISLDTDLPGINGFKICSEHKQRHLTARTPIIFVSGHASAENRERALKLGVECYIEKPLDASVFVARVCSHIGLTNNQKFAVGTP